MKQPILRLEQLNQRSFSIWIALICTGVQSLGLFYETVTAFLGIGSWQHCGKTMALSSYGEPNFFSLNEDGFSFNYDEITAINGKKPTPAEAIEIFYYQHKSIIYNELRAHGLSEFGNKFSVTFVQPEPKRLKNAKNESQ